MKLTDKIQNIVLESCRLEREAYAVAQLAAPKDNEFVYCFHNRITYPSWSVWPKNESYDGPKYCEIQFIDRELKVKKNKGFSEEEIYDICIYLTNFLDEE